MRVSDLSTITRCTQSAEAQSNTRRDKYPAQMMRASHPIFFGSAVANAMDLSGIEGAEKTRNNEGNLTLLSY
jgi:hypothetical protein